MTMLVTPESNRRNQIQAVALTGIVAVTSAVAWWFFPPLIFTLGGDPCGD